MNEQRHPVSRLPQSSRAPIGAHRSLAVSERKAAALMAVVAATLAVMSFLHLSGILGGGTTSFDRSSAGTAEAVIGLVLGYGAVRLLRRRPGAQTVALATTGFAIVGFLVGLRFTLADGGAIDIAYHIAALPILLIALIGLLRIRIHNTRSLPMKARPKQGVGS